MGKRTAVVAAVLLGLLVPVVPASAARRVAVTGRVLDENGRGIPSATVRFSVDAAYFPSPGVLDAFVDGMFCLFSFGLFCDEAPEPDTTSPLEVTARTDASGRYVLRFDPDWRVGAHYPHDVSITRPPLVRQTLPPTTHTTVRYRGGRTLPTFRLWLRGTTLDKVSTTERRLSAAVPRSLGTPVSPPEVVLVQGKATVWSYGDVSHDRAVDARVAESGTTGTQTEVTTKSGTTYTHYRSGVRPVPKAMRPLSRGKSCYAYRGLGKEEIPQCPQTDGRLAYKARTYPSQGILVDLGELSAPKAYVVRGCTVYALEASTEGVVFVDVVVQENEPGVLTGEPALPVRYVRVQLGYCAPTEVSIFGAVFLDDLPAATSP